jgi:hypothetical protein
MGHSEKPTNSQIVFMTLRSAGAHHCRAFYQATEKCAIMLSQNQFAWAKPTFFHFSSSNFTVQYQVLSPAGDGFKHTSQGENFTFQITEIVQKEKVTFFRKKVLEKLPYIPYW